jgi:hypothetical protein
MSNRLLWRFHEWSIDPNHGDNDFCFVPYKLYEELKADMAEKALKLGFFNLENRKLSIHGIPSLLVLGKWAVPDSYRKETYIAANGWNSPLV